MLVVAVRHFPQQQSTPQVFMRVYGFVRKDGVRGVVANSHTSGPWRRAAVSEPPRGPPRLGVRVKIKLAAFVKARMRAGLNWAGKCWRLCPCILVYRQPVWFVPLCARLCTQSFCISRLRERTHTLQCGQVSDAL